MFKVLVGVINRRSNWSHGPQRVNTPSWVRQTESWECPCPVIAIVLCLDAPLPRLVARSWLTCCMGSFSWWDLLAQLGYTNRVAPVSGHNGGPTRSLLTCAW